MKLNRLLPVSAALVAGLLSSGATMAADTLNGGNFGVKIAITSECTVDAAKTDLDFGSKASTATAAATANNGGFSVTCTNQTPYSIGLQSTAGSSSSDGSGTMKATVGSTEYTIGYQLYQDAGDSAPWGNSNAGSINTKEALGSGIAQAHTVFGKTTSTLNVPVATYTDTVAVSIYY